MRQFEVPAYAAVSDTGFIFLGNSGETFNLNEIGKEIFDLIRLKMNTEEVFKEILDNYEVDRQTFERDFEDFINRLLSYGLIKEI
ncbi:MAG: PqqD family protein [Ignavibacteriales bacterium]|nr:PqqD family protein [Ignavibacteriales bacterium]